MSRCINISVFIFIIPCKYGVIGENMIGCSRVNRMLNGGINFRVEKSLQKVREGQQLAYGDFWKHGATIEYMATLVHLIYI